MKIVEEKFSKFIRNDICYQISLWFLIPAIFVSKNSPSMFHYLDFISTTSITVIGISKFSKFVIDVYLFKRDYANLLIFNWPLYSFGKINFETIAKI